MAKEPDDRFLQAVLGLILVGEASWTFLMLIWTSVVQSQSEGRGLGVDTWAKLAAMWLAPQLLVAPLVGGIAITLFRRRRSRLERRR